jgi:hypothetical protein
MFRIDSARVLVVKNEDNQLTTMKNQWQSRDREMRDLLLNKQMKELKIERAEQKRRIEQLEDQNDDLLLELASLRMNKSLSDVRSGFDGENSISVIVTNNNNNNDDDWKRIEQKEEGSDGGNNNNKNNNNNCNATIPRRNSDAITSPRCSPYGSRRATIGVTTPNSVKSSLSTHSILRRSCSSATHITSRRGSRRVTIAGSSPYSANDVSGTGGSGSSSTSRRRISSSSKDLLRICKGFVLLDDDDEAPSSGGEHNSKW